MKTLEETLMDVIAKHSKAGDQQRTWSGKLKGMPTTCRFTPLDDRKKPVDPRTGRGSYDWQLHGYAVEELDGFDPTKVKAIGLMVGEISGGIAALDFDGPGSHETFRHHFGHGVDELPTTVTWTSGVPDRYQAAFLVPKEWWSRLGQKMLKLDGQGDCELRWNHQSAISGTHPNWEDTINKTGFGKGPGNGYYSFVNKPTEHEIAPAPSWFLEGWEAICNPGASSGGGGFLSKEAKSNLFQRSSIDARYDAFKCQEILRDWLQPATDYQDYETWLTVGMVCRRISLELDEPDHLFEVYNGWSKQQDNYDGENALYKKWLSLNREGEGSKGLGWLIDFAKEKTEYSGPSKSRKEFLDDLPGADKKAVKAEEEIEDIEAFINNYYALEKANGPWHETRHARAQLTRRQINGDDLDRRLVEMVAEEWGLAINDSGNAPRKTRNMLDTYFDEAGLKALIPGFIHAGSDAVAVADAGVGKTMFGLLCSHYASCGGKPFDQNKHVDQNRTGRTLWIGSDGGDGAEAMIRSYIKLIKAPGEAMWRSRLDLWCGNQAEGIPPWALNVRGLHQLFWALKDAQDAGEPYRLIVIDSLKCVFDAGGVNFGIGAVGTVMRMMQAAASRFDCSVLWLHHTKEDSRGDGPGSSGGNKNITQVPYSVINLWKKPGDGGKQVVRCRVSKFRGEGARQFDYTLDDEIGLVKIVDEELGLQSKLLMEIRIRRDAGITMRELQESQTLAKSTVSNKCTSMAKAGLIENRKSRWWIKPEGAKNLAVDHPEIAGDVNAWLQ